MGFRTLDLDNKEQAEEYKRSKKHSKFVKENKPDDLKPVEDDYVEELQVPGYILYGKVVGVDQLRLRREPEGDIIELIPRNNEVEVLGFHDEIWYRVRNLSSGTEGYVMKKFLFTFSESEPIDSYGSSDSRRCKVCPTK